VQRRHIRASIILSTLPLVVGVVIFITLHRTITSSVTTIRVDSTAYLTGGAVDTQNKNVVLTGLVRYGARLWIVDAVTGTSRRIVSLADPPTGIAIDEKTDHLFVVSGQRPYVRVLDATSGVQLAVTSTGYWPRGATFISRPLVIDSRDGHVFVATPDGGGIPAHPSIISMLDARNGHLLKTISVGRGLIGLAINAQIDHLFALNARDGTVSTINARDGMVLTTTVVGRNPLSMAVDALTTRLFVTGNAFPIGPGPLGTKGYVSVLDTRTNTLLNRVTVGRLPTALAVDDRRSIVFVANSEDNTVSLLDGRRGLVLRTTTVGQTPTAVAVDARIGRVFVAAANSIQPIRPNLSLAGAGSVSVLDAQRGIQQRVISAGVDPMLILVDEYTHRVFVVNKGGRIPMRDAGTWRWIPPQLRSLFHISPLQTPRWHDVPGDIDTFNASQ